MLSKRDAELVDHAAELQADGVLGPDQMGIILQSAEDQDALIAALTVRGIEAREDARPVSSPRRRRRIAAEAT
jgi:hypothetical protein